MGREIPYSNNEKCDICGHSGSFDFMGDFYCQECIDAIDELKEKQKEISKKAKAKYD